MNTFATGVACVLGLAAFAPAHALADSPAAKPTAQQARTATLQVGDAAPDFTLPDTNFKPVRLADFRGQKNVVLAFYVLAFTGG